MCVRARARAEGTPLFRSRALVSNEIHIPKLMSYMMSQSTQDVSFVLLSHFSNDINIPKNDVLYNVLNHTGRQFGAFVSYLKRDPSLKN